jgi:RNA polymerase sigma factor FliA
MVQFLTGISWGKDSGVSSPSSTYQQLIEENQGLVRSLAVQIHRKLAQKGDLDDLIAYGQVGLAEAAREFDAERGNQFSTYAYYRIRGAIYDGLGKMNWFGRAHYQQAKREQMDQEAVKSSNEEPGAVRTDDKELGPRQPRGLNGGLNAIYLAVNNQMLRDSSSEPFPMVDRSALTPSTVLMGRESREKLHELINTLPADEANFIRAAYFEGLSLQEAGEKMGISKSWASRLHERILSRLARSLKLSGIS